MPESLPHSRSVPTSREAAIRAINTIRSERGYISQDIEFHLKSESCLPELRDDYLRTKETQKKVYARYTRTVSDQLYSSNSRFIHELIQNADDADYRDDKTPCITFHLRAKDLTVEINEEGFTYANVAAICSTGESSKKNDPQSTGNKGLGFKSVFGIAKRVDILSGTWSFYFEPKPNDDGLGMVMPYWNDRETESLPPGVGTRFRLHYRDKGEKSMKKLVEAFQAIPETIVFALKKLARVVIILDKVCDNDYTYTHERSGSLQSGEVVIYTTVNNGGQAQRLQETKLRTFQKTSTNSLDDEYHVERNPTVTLGFPVSPSGHSLLTRRGQDVFACLPVQHIKQLPFLIQADFFLLANREQIPETQWNGELRDLVAQVFGEAVESFCVAPADPLRYEWPAYVPASSIDGFWSDLKELIKDDLIERYILESWCGTRLAQPSGLRFLPPVFLHEEEPLLPDILNEELYLSAKYDVHLDLLIDYGVDELTEDEMMKRVVRDLAAPKPILRIKSLGDKWHAAFTAFAHHILSTGSPSSQNALKKLLFIPLANDRWTSLKGVERDPVYMPYINDEEIRLSLPYESLKLRVLHPLAHKDAKRRNFYAQRNVGVFQCPPDFVIEQIMSAQGAETKWTLSDSVSAFEILFWLDTEPANKRPKKAKRATLFAYDSNLVFRKCSSLFSCTSSPCDHPYHARELLKHTSRDKLSKAGYGFLHKDYLKSTLRDRQRHGRLWFQWLRDTAKVAEYPKLQITNNNEPILSPVMDLVAKDNMVAFVPNLKSHWTESYSRQDWEAIVPEVKCLKVKGIRNAAYHLDNTVLPTEALLEKSQKYGLENAPFLELPEEIAISEEMDWQFLEKFGVICHPNYKFYFRMLEVLQKKATDSHQRILRAAASIYRDLLDSSTFGDEVKLKRRFKKIEGIYCGHKTRLWRGIEDCVWDGAPMLRSKVALKHFYDTPDLKRLMVDMLGIKNANCKTYLDELRYLSSSTSTKVPDPSMANLNALYEAFRGVNATKGKDGRDFVRKAFDDEPLTFVEGGWRSTSSCIWNGPFELSDKYSLESLYPDLEEFFVDQLGVSKMSPVVVMQKLITQSEATAPGPDPAELKNLIIVIGQLMDPDQLLDSDDEDSDDEDAVKLLEALEDLRECVCVPVLTDTQERRLVKFSEAFYLTDHSGYAKAFRGKVPFADFSPSDMPSIHLLIRALKLEYRYLTEAVVPTNDIVADTSEMDHDYTRRLRRRAHALSCCAVRYKSAEYRDRTHNPHAKLLTAAIHVSPEMWTTLSIQHDELDIDVKVKSDRVDMKTDITQDALNITMPADPIKKTSCYRQRLPQVLTDILGISHQPDALKAIYRILNDRDMTIGEIMADEDISDVPWLPKSNLDDDAIEVTRRASHTNGTQRRGERRTSRPLSRSRSSSRQSSTNSVQEQIPSLSINPLIPPYRDANPIPQRNAYRAFLENVQQQARLIPARFRNWAVDNVDGFDESSLSPIVESTDEHLGLLDPEEQTLALGITNDHSTFWQERTRIGSAGELFVFELFQELLDDFELRNWESSKRDVVNVLEEYADLQAPRKIEDADIVYTDDEHGTFESFLREHAHNSDFPTLPDDDDGAGIVPLQYLIEVKSTPGPCNMPFFLSKKQYKLMKQHAIERQRQEVNTVYVIVRVYNLFTSNIDMEIFVDPWELKGNDLKFEANKYIVTTDI